MVYVYDTEITTNCFLLCASDGSSFEISAFKNELPLLREWLKNVTALIGFNNVGFDYPLLHFVVTNGITDPRMIYDMAQAIITAENRWTHTVKPSDYLVRQIDLFKIHHFDNKARTTSLKNLEFNMRMANISDLPFPVGKVLTREEIEVLRTYCFNDVGATRQFYRHTKPMIALRDSLSAQYGFDFTNFSDVKIGKEIFQKALESRGVVLYDYGEAGRIPRQTHRPSIALRDCVPALVNFDRAEFNAIRRRFMDTTITETKGAFDLSATVDGMVYYFGTGGIHASVEQKSFHASDDWMILDVDVTGMYPAIAMSQRYYPEHLGPAFVEVYEHLRDLRAKFPKGTPENAAYKLAMNGVYGASNDPYSVFFDPLFTMRITIGGQLMLAMLIERLLEVPNVRIIQANTDGVSMFLPRDHLWLVRRVCEGWESITDLTLEHAEYSTMVIRDVNNYLAQKTDGSVKRKGAFEYDIDWHQDGSALVVQKVAEKVLLDGAPVRQTIENWPDLFDFMLRARVNSSSSLKLVKGGTVTPLERTTRYYISKDGGELVKTMPPLAKKPGVWRDFAIQKGWRVTPRNDIFDYTGNIDFDWYVEQVERLIYGAM